jgi:hypothetical protein
MVFIGRARFLLSTFSCYAQYIGPVGQGVGTIRDCASCMMSASVGVLSFRSNGCFSRGFCSI